MEYRSLSEETETRLVPGDLAWVILALGIIGYDLVALSTKRAETLSSALWRSLSHPRKLPVLLSIWTALTWHLFANTKARESYKVHVVKFNSMKEIKKGSSKYE